MNNYKNIYTRSLKEMNLKLKENINKEDVFFRPNDVIHKIPYKVNSHGYRCEEFTNQKVLTLGCSQTFGDGMFLENTWPYLLSKKINKPYINLAKGGDGIQAQVIKTFQFFKEFYHPEYIFGYFPLFRLEMPIVKDFFEFDDRKGLLHSSEIMSVLLADDEMEKYSKIPHDPRDVIPKEFAIFYNLMFIKMLDQYCKTNNIKFFWTIWRDANINVLSTENFNNIIKNIDSDNFIINQDLMLWNYQNLDCHSEYKNNILFEHAADKTDTQSGHWGIHQHMHVADFMYSVL